MEGVRVQWQKSKVPIQFRRQQGHQSSLCRRKTGSELWFRHSGLATCARRTGRTGQGPGTSISCPHLILVLYAILFLQTTSSLTSGLVQVCHMTGYAELGEKHFWTQGARGLMDSALQAAVLNACEGGVGLLWGMGLRWLSHPRQLSFLLFNAIISLPFSLLKCQMSASNKTRKWL